MKSSTNLKSPAEKELIAKKIAAIVLAAFYLGTFFI